MDRTNENTVDKFFDFLVRVIQIFKPDQKKWIVRIFISTGIALILQPAWEPYLQAVLDKYFQLNIPNSAPTGWTFVALGILLHLANLYIENVSKRKKVVKVQPSLKLDFENKDPFEYTEPSGSKKHAIRGFRVRVTNIGTEDIDNCIVYLDKMSSLSGPGFENAYLPIALITQKQKQQRRQGGEFKLRVGQPKFIEVAWLDEKKADSEIVLQYEDPNTPNLVRRGDYMLTLVAYGGGPPVSETFRLFVDEQRYLQFQPYIPEPLEKQTWTEEILVVEFRWPVASGFQQSMEKEGYKLRWSKPENVPTRRSEGYELMFDIDPEARIKRRIQLKDDSVLIGKRA